MKFWEFETLRRASFVGVLSLAILGGASCQDSLAQAPVIPTVEPQPVAPVEQPPSVLAASSGFIQVDEGSLQVQYGVYAEIEAKLVGNVSTAIDWQAVESALPAGLALEETQGTEVLLFGTPEFTGTWCFTLGATTADEVVSQERLCLNSESNDEIAHPKFATDSLLPNGHLGQDYSVTIQLYRESAVSMTGSFVDGVFPEGLELSNDDSEFQFSIWGKPAKIDAYFFVLKATNGDGQETSQQFQMTVDGNDAANPAPPSCAPGYYFDPELNRCVQNGAVACGDGTYYDPESDSCVAYPQPPPQIICGPGHYFDPFLSRCVRQSYPRCPIDYRWDTYSERCVREPYSCPIGFAYDWYFRECRSVWTRVCRAGTYFDPHYNACIAYRRECRPGDFWNPRSDSCERNRHSCGNDQYWDNGRCHDRDRRRTCGPREHYDPRSDRCQPNRPDRSCGPGWHWDNVNSCVPDRRPPPPMPMPPPPMPMPMNLDVLR